MVANFKRAGGLAVAAENRTFLAFGRLTFARPKKRCFVSVSSFPSARNGEGNAQKLEDRGAIASAEARPEKGTQARGRISYWSAGRKGGGD